jgi:hypothetical protein
VNERQRREALGIGLIALGVLISLALLPPLLFGRTDAGNLIGPAGELLRSSLGFVFGLSALLVALPAFVWALWCFGVLERGTAIRWSVLLGGAMLFLPAGWWFVGMAAGGTGAGAGWMGRATAEALRTAFGTVGAQLIVGALILALIVLTLGISPRNLAALASRGLSRLARTAWHAALGAWAALRNRLADRARSDPLPVESPWEPPPTPAPEPEDEDTPEVARRSSFSSCPSAPDRASQRGSSNGSVRS